MSIDRRGVLGQMAPFAYRASKDGKVFISWHGKVVKTLSGAAAERFLVQMAGIDDFDAQLVMAKATGNFKHGNERLRVHGG